MPRIGTLMMRSRSFPMMDSSAMMSAMFSRIDWRTFWRWRRRSPAERSDRSASEGRKRERCSTAGILHSPTARLYRGATDARCVRLGPDRGNGAPSATVAIGSATGRGATSGRVPTGSALAPRASVLPEIVGGVLEDHVDAVRSSRSRAGSAPSTLYLSVCSSSRVRALVMMRLMSRTEVISFFSIASLSGS